MGIRSTLAAVLSTPATVVLEDAIRDWIDEAIDQRKVVGGEALAELDGRLDALRRDIGRLRGEVDGVRQALEAWSDDLDDEELPITATLIEVLEDLEGQSASLKNRLDLTRGAVTATANRLDVVEDAADRIGGVAEQAVQVATTAQATAESVADGLNELESRLQGR